MLVLPNKNAVFNIIENFIISNVTFFTCKIRVRLGCSISIIFFFFFLMSFFEFEL